MMCENLSRLVARNVLLGGLAFGVGIGINLTAWSAEPTIACGALYTVERGDTLFAIAERAYADGKLYTKIFESNAEIMPNISSLEVGAQVFIPCLDGTGLTSRREAILSDPQVEPVDQATTADPTPATTQTEIVPELTGRAMRLLTGSGFAPYADKFIFSGGIVNDLLQTAIHAEIPDQAIHVAFINDWPAHLETLLRDGAYEVGFPWYKPDCANADGLAEDLRMRCNEFKFSNPIIEIAVGFYGRTDDPFIGSTRQYELIEKTVCRPKGHFLFDDDRIDLMEPDVSMVFADTVGECFERLSRKEVDLVALVKSRADAQILELGMTEKVVEIESLAFSQTVHAVVHKSNPNGKADLDVINRGLANLMASGQWFSVVAVHEREFLAPKN